MITRTPRLAPLQALRQALPVGMMDSTSKAALVLVGGRFVGYVAAFTIPVGLARLLEPAQFGTYTQVLLLLSTLSGLAQCGMSESLYYFLPRAHAHTSRFVWNALVTLGVSGVVCTLIILGVRQPIAHWLHNDELASLLVMLSLLLTVTLLSTAPEIVLIARRQHRLAAFAYASSDMVRAALILGPAFAFRSVRAVVIGMLIFTVLRCAVFATYLFKQFGPTLRFDVVLWKQQLKYALPFAAAVALEVAQASYHQYAVASWFSPAVFAVYAVGCLQLPVVDLLAMTTANVMMVKMGEDLSQGRSSIALWHDTVSRLTLIFFPLVAMLLLIAGDIIGLLFTASYAASVPIFRITLLLILLGAFPVDAVLRVYAQTHVLIALNLVRLVFVATSIAWFVSTLQLPGAVLVTVLATTLAKSIGIMRIASIMRVPVSSVLPWGTLLQTVIAATVAAAPALLLRANVALPPILMAPAVAVTYGTTYIVVRWGIWNLVSRTRRQMPTAPPTWNPTVAPVDHLEHTAEPGR